MQARDRHHAYLIGKYNLASALEQEAKANLAEYERFLNEGSQAFEQATEPAPATRAPTPTASAKPVTQPAPVQAAPVQTPQAAPVQTPAETTATSAKVNPFLPKNKRGVVAAPPPGFKKDGTPKKKPGPQKGFRKNEQTEAPVQAAQPVVAEASSEDAERTRIKPGPKVGPKRDDIPKFTEAIQLVMGDKMLNAKMIYEALVSHEWLPRSSDPENYIRYTLSRNKDLYKAVEGRRGFYRLAGAPITSTKTNVAKAPEVATPAPVRVAPPTTRQKPATSEASRQEVDDFLTSSGIDLKTTNPFAG